MPRLLLTLVLLGLVFYPLMADDSEEEKKQYEKNLAECMKESKNKITEDLLAKMHQKDFKTDDHDVYCFVKCMGDKSGILNANGEVDMDKAIAAHEDMKEKEEVLKAAHTKCATEKGADACETAFKQWRCLGDNIGWE